MADRAVVASEMEKRSGNDRGAQPKSPGAPPGRKVAQLAAKPGRQDAAPDRHFRARVPLLTRRAADSAPANGLPAQLKAGVEALSGLAMDDVRVHRDSSEPARLGALAFARGSDIHLGPGQERHLPHETWHVVQQKQGRVKATTQMKGVNISEDVHLEGEADSARALIAATSVVPLRDPAGKTSKLDRPAVGAATAQLQPKEKDPEKPPKPSRIKYATTADQINAKIAYFLDAGFRERFKQWEASGDVYLIKKDEDATERLVDAMPKEVDVSTLEEDERDNLNVSPEDCLFEVPYSRRGRQENDTVPSTFPDIGPLPKIEVPIIRIVWNTTIDVGKILLEIPKVIFGLTVGLFAGIWNLFAKKKLGWGLANRISDGTSGMNLISYGVGDYNNYNFLCMPIHPTPKTKMSPSDDALIGVIGRGKRKAIRGQSRLHKKRTRPKSFLTIGKELRSGWQAVLRIGSRKLRKRWRRLMDNRY